MKEKTSKNKNKIITKIKENYHGKRILAMERV